MFIFMSCFIYDFWPYYKEPSSSFKRVLGLVLGCDRPWFLDNGLFCFLEFSRV